MGMTESLYEYALNSGNPAIHPDRLYRCARLWGRCFWGTQYPDQEVTDDIENYRALELLHADMMLRHKTWQALISDPAEKEDQAKAILKEIMAIREVRDLPKLTAEYN
jgi:Amt family ammonium transporter